MGPHPHLAMLALTLVLGAVVPARISYATETAITDRPVLPLARGAVRPIAGAAAVVSGCPSLPKDGNTLVYRLRFADGVEANLGSWWPVTGSHLAALETIAARLPAGAARERFINPIRSDPLAPECVKTFAGQVDVDGLTRLLRLLAVSDAERKGRF
jgi:hypothetical protein